MSSAISGEIVDYSADAFEKAQLYSWTESEREEIEEKSLLRIKNIIKNYSDIILNKKEAEEFIKETIEEMLI
ncbi:MAG: hypothetical protein KAK00_07440 [Nanoarchaeota archaeon]|nr:hypothetical protein [Nanoarchaeota archaeon]